MADIRDPRKNTQPWSGPGAPHPQAQQKPPAQKQTAQREREPAKEPSRYAIMQQLVTRRMVPAVRPLLGKSEDAERFARMFLSAIEAADAAAKPGANKLVECTEASLCRAMLHSAELGLLPGGPYPHAYLIPYRNADADRVEAQFQISVWGYTELVRRAGVRKVWADVIYEGDEYECISGTAGKSIVHKPQWFAARGDRGKVLGSYACAMLDNGETVFEPVSFEDLETARKQNHGKSPAWALWHDQQCQKVAIKRLSKYLPKGDDRASRALAIDENPNTPAVIDVPGLPVDEPTNAPDGTAASVLDQVVANASKQAAHPRLTIERDKLFELLCITDERWKGLRARVDGWDEMQALAAMAFLMAIQNDISVGNDGEPPTMPEHLRLDD